MITARDMAIVGWLDSVGYARTSQVAAVHVPRRTQSVLIARRRLRALHEAGMVRRFSDSRLGEYVWHTRAKEKGQKYEHGLMVSSVAAALAVHPSLYSYDYTPAYRRETGTGYSFEADAFAVCCGRHPDGTDVTTLAFIECDHAEDLSTWQAWRRYADYLLAGDWRAEDWWRRFETFPRVVFVGRADRLTVMRRRIADAGGAGRLSFGWLDVTELARGNLAALGWPRRKGVGSDA